MQSAIQNAGHHGHGGDSHHHHTPPTGGRGKHSGGGSKAGGGTTKSLTKSPPAASGAQPQSGSGAVGGSFSNIPATVAKRNLPKSIGMLTGDAK